MQIELTKMSSKGQVVIPAEMRKDIKEGEKLLVIRNNGQIILQKATEANKKFKEDLEFAKRTEEAWKSYDKGEFKSMKTEDFLKELDKW